VAHGKKLLDAGRRAGFATEMDWILEILHWPVEWSALHGIAEIKTPILKISTKTDATAKKYLIQRRGTRYPVEGAQGLKFPYQMPDHLHLTDSKGFKQGLHNPLPLVGDVPPEHFASDNGFVSSIAMDHAHKPIVDLALKTLDGRSGNIVDLGCGNGALLKKIVQAHQRLFPFGIEPDPARVEHARKMHPQFADNFILGDMFKIDRVWDANRRFALALIMPGRLLESRPEQAAELKRHLKEQCDSILVYAYGDWLTRFGNLAGLAEKAGLKLVSADAEGSVGLATIA
jgi:SAM-dependent methyltransferase